MPKPVPTKLLKARWGCRETDRKAWSTVDLCCRRLRLDRVPLPIPVEDWIERALRIRFGYGDLSHLGPNVLGAAYLKEGEIIIDENVLAHEGRCRFTCAHELGHMVLHKHVAARFEDSKNDVTFSTDKYERQADRFAAAFLMPLPDLEREIVHALDERRLDRGACVQELTYPTTESEWLWRYRVLPRLTQRFDVSVSAAILRCTEVEPDIRSPRPLLPRSLSKRLLAPVDHGDAVQHVQIVNQRPRYRDLFTAG